MSPNGFLSARATEYHHSCFCDFTETVTNAQLAQNYAIIGSSHWIEQDYYSPLAFGRGKTDRAPRQPRRQREWLRPI